jgi:uncharacterized protein YegL
MPRFDPGTPMLSRRLAGTTYGYSGTRLDDLSCSEYTLVAVASDQSGSVSAFRTELEACLGEIVRACQQHPRAEQVMLRLSAFDGDLHELHGFKPLPTLDPADYTGSLRPGGATALHDAALNAVGAVRSYGETLSAQGFTVNGLVFVLTDGEDNASSAAAAQVAQEVQAAIASEHLESLRTVLVGVGTLGATGQALMRFSAEAGFDDFLPLAQADASHLQRLARFASQSIGLQSTALGSGSASLSLTF